jgi:PAS domain S-box-containing protein
MTKKKDYRSELNSILIRQSQNEVFYTGNIEAACYEILNLAANSLMAERSSIWRYESSKESLTLIKLYTRDHGYSSGNEELKKVDYDPYFEYLLNEDVISAEDAENHPATSCFLESYLKPFGIKSILDVPIWYKGRVIGVICIEDVKIREWKEEEIDFCQVLSFFYSFAYSIKENNIKELELINRMDAINRSNLVIEFDLSGKIMYANDLFLQKMGYDTVENGGLEKIKGIHHSIFVTPEVADSKEYKDFWGTLSQGNFYLGEFERVKKDGSKVYLQATYNPIADLDGKIYRVMKIATDITENIQQRKEIERKNNYLEHAAKIIRHDMHSGINTYIPRGISALERRLSKEKIEELNIESPLKMIKEGLRHTQKVYKGVYEFTNLVKKDAYLNKSTANLKDILDSYLSSTSYKSQVEICDLGECEVNEPLFCTAIDNLIRNGLKYNDSDKKGVKIYREGNSILLEDNGRGLSSEEFKHLSQPYMRKEGQKESGTGLGLNICTAILEEHGFSLSCEKIPQGGTQIKINIQNEK